MALLYLAIATLSGVLLGQALAERGYFGCGLPVWLWLIPAALIPLTALLSRLEREPQIALTWPAAAGFRAPRRRPSLALIVACGLCLSMGVLRIAGRPLLPCWTPDDLAYYNQPAGRAFDGSGPWVTVSGHVSQFVPQATGSTRLYVEARMIEITSGVRPVQGEVMLLADDTLGLQYGDPVRLRGVLSVPPEFADFSYRDYLARHGVYSQMSIAQVTPLPGPAQGNPLLRALYVVRERGETLINESLPEPYAALSNGMLLGIDANIPDAVMADFNDTSTTHVLVISGSNVALITGVLLVVGLHLFGRKGAALWAIGGIALYALLVGGEPSVTRAALMGSLVVIAVALGRQSTALVGLGAASLILVLVNPHTLWDVGFQLSAVATAGLVLVAPRLMRSSRRLIEGAPSANARTESPLRSIWRRGALGLADALAITLAASLAVTPLLLYYFHRMTVIGLLTNLLIAPVQPLILFAGMAALGVGLIGMPSLALPLYGLAWAGLAWTLSVVERTASVPWASTAIVGYGLGALAITYALMALLLTQGRRRPIYEKPRPVTAPVWQRLLGAPATMAALTVTGLFVWNGVRLLPDGRLHVHALRAESGSSIFIQTPSGRQVLIDGGDDAGRLLTELGSVMSPWDRTLDLVMLTRDHPRTAQAQTAMAERLHVAHAQTSAAIAAENVTWSTAMTAEGAAMTDAGAAGWADLGDGVSLWTLSPAAGKKGPLVLWLEYGEFGALIPGAVPKLLPADEGWSMPRAPDLLVLPDAGAKGEERAAFVEAIAAKQVVIYGDAKLVQQAGQTSAHYVGTAGPFDFTSDGATWEVAGD